MATTLEKKGPKQETLPRHLPVSRMEEMMRDVEHLWERAFPLRFEMFGRMPELRKVEFDWSPRVDAWEKDGEILVRADLPGVKKENIDLHFEEGELVIKGERTEEKERKEKDMYHCERYFGSFYRRIPLGFELDPKLVNATFHNGVLELKIPLPPKVEPEPKRIPVA